VLAAPACSVLILRALPLASRLANLTAARARRVVLPLASWSIGRRPLRQAGALLITVISLVTAMLALSQFRTGQQTASDLATFSTGSDYRLDLTDGALAPGQAGRLAAPPGATASMPVLRTSTTSSDNATTVSVLGLTATQAPSVVLLRQDLSAQPVSALSRQIAPAAAAGTASSPRSLVTPGAVLPGRPQRAEITATLSPVRGLAFPLLQLQLRDRAGLYYDVTAGPLPADGRPHTLTAPLAVGGHAAYPLRLAGIQLTFAPAAGRIRHGTLRVGAIRLATSASGPFPASARPVRGLLPAASTRFEAGPNGTPQGASLAEISWLHRTAVLPVIATRAFLAVSHQRIGSVISLPVANQPTRMRIVAAVSAFPTIPPTGPGLILDGGPLQQNLLIAGAPPLPATQWWVRSARDPRVRGAIPGLQVTGRAAATAALTGSLFDQDVREALAAVALAAVLLAIAGFALTASATRERKPELALLDALGMPPGQLRRMLCAEQVLMAVPSAATGLLLGVLLAHLIVPSLTITPTGGIPALPVLVQIPWTAAVIIAAIIAAFPVLIAPLAARTGETISVLRQGAQE
jgi:FtsX-like permease family